MKYEIEVAKSGRSTCSGCERKIVNGRLRLIILTQRWHYIQSTYYCENCGRDILLKEQNKINHSLNILSNTALGVEEFIRIQDMEE